MLVRKTGVVVASLALMVLAGVLRGDGPPDAAPRRQAHARLVWAIGKVNAAPPAPGTGGERAAALAAAALAAGAGDPQPGIKLMADDRMFGPHASMCYAALAGEAHWRLGNAADAARHLDDAVARGEKLLRGWSPVHGSTWSDYRLIAAVLVRCQDDARLGRLLEAAEADPTNGTKAELRAFVAELYADAGDLARAAAMARQAPAGYHPGRARVMALLTVATAAERAGKRDDAAALVFDALTTEYSHPRMINEWREQVGRLAALATPALVRKAADAAVPLLVTPVNEAKRVVFDALLAAGDLSGAADVVRGMGDRAAVDRFDGPPLEARVGSWLALARAYHATGEPGKARAAAADGLRPPSARTVIPTTRTTATSCRRTR